MKILYTIAKIADSIVSLGLIVVGCYLFFWKQEWITGAILIAVHQFYQIGTVYCLNNLAHINNKVGSELKAIEEDK